MAELSFQNQIRLNNLGLTSRLMQGAFNNTYKTKNSSNPLTSLSVNKNSGKYIYAAEGDAKYKAESDYDGNGIVTFNEYVKYITENLSEKNNIPKSVTSYKNEEDSATGLVKFTITNLNKALTSYINNAAKLPVSLIETEA